MIIQFPNPETLQSGKPAVRRDGMRRPNQEGTRGRQERYLSTKQVADWLGYSDRTVTGWAVAWHDSGGTEGLPCRRLGRRKWSFIEAEVQAWVDAGGLSRCAVPQAKSSAGPKAAPVTKTGTL